MNSIIGKKIGQTQKFLEDGTRIPVTEVYVPANPVVALRTQDKNGYWALQIGFGSLKSANKSLLGHVKGANLKTAPQFLREVRVKADEAESLPKVGESISAQSVFKPGDIIDATGTSKGKGYAGGVKRYHFKGGPRTHGQSDRERAPGSIGQTTTPGRVYRGKRMAGRMGKDKVTIKNLEVVEVLEDKILVKGVVPGGKNGLVMLKKVGEAKKFVPLFKEETEAKEEIKEESIAEEPKVEAEASQEEVKEEKKQVEEAQSQPTEEKQEEAKTEEPKEEKKEELKEDK